MHGAFRIVPAILITAALAVPFAAAQTKPVAGQTKAVQAMAGILADLNHFPSDAEKEQLKKIVTAKETTEHERVVAQALLNVQHKVSGEDRPKLEAVIKDPSAPEPVKTLARTIVNLNHTPTDAEKAQLKKLAAS